MYTLQYLVINRNFYLMNKGNKEVLQQNARGVVVMVTPHYVSEKADDLLGAIVKKVSSIKPDETTLRKVLANEPLNIPLSNETIEGIENKLEHILETLSSESTIESVTSDISNLGYNFSRN